MNLLLLKPDDFIDDNTVEINGDRFRHLKKIKKVSINDIIPVGVLNKDMGYGTVLAIDNHSIQLAIQLSFSPPSAPPITLIVALPRPLMFKRILQNITALGIKDIHFIHSEKVEKSYWSSSDIEEPIVHEQLMLGLEQAMDTALPTVHFHHKFHLFANKVLPELSQHATCLLGDILGKPCPTNIQESLVLAIGPEGGFTEKEVAVFKDSGFLTVTLGPRTLRVETAVSAFLGRVISL